MKHFTLSNKDKFPALGLGTWKSKPGEVYEAVREAIRLGYRHFDCAAIYTNEAEIGNALTDAINNGDVSRSQLWITSKLWNNAHRSDDVRAGLNKTLSDLQLDYIDLYLIHWPVALKPGVGFPGSEDDFLPLSEAPIEETWKEMEKCVKSGLIKHIGVSNFSIKKIGELLSECEIKPEVNQIELHPFLQQNNMLEYCNENNIVLTAYSPLGSTDRPAQFKAPDEPSLMENPTIVRIAEENEISPAQVLISWAIQRGTSVIPKSVNPSRLKQNLEAADVQLSEQNMRDILALDVNGRYIVGVFWSAPSKGYTLENLWDE